MFLLPFLSIISLVFRKNRKKIYKTRGACWPLKRKRKEKRD
jgi:hypothetical protein